MKTEIITSDKYLKSTWDKKRINKMYLLAKKYNLSPWIVKSTKEMIEIGLAGSRLDLIRYYMKSFKYEDSSFYKKLKRIIYILLP